MLPVSVRICLQEVTTMTPRDTEDINLLSSFLGIRDVPELTREALLAFWNAPRADLLVLFGGTILCGADVLAEAMQRRIAAHYLIVGGEGHTTPALRQAVHAACPSLPVENQPEAFLLQAYLNVKYGLSADAIESRSTNCGNNISNMLALARRLSFPCRSMILCQDASMQRRMDATLRRCAPETEILNYATYQVRLRDDGTFDPLPDGMWPLSRYLSLLMGEIPRLRDDAGGYGPKGAGYIAHVAVPEAVEAAFARLAEHFGDRIRAADPAFASSLNHDNHLPGGNLC